MKIFTFFLFTLFLSVSAFSQKQLQFMNQRFEFNAVRNGQPVRMETKDYGLNINYDTGEFFAKINLTESRLYADEEVEYRIPGDEYLEIKGFLPVLEIFENNSQNQVLKVELNVQHVGTIVPVVFTLHLNRLKNASGKFTMFNLSGMANLNDFGVVDLKGYEPEINIVLDFQSVFTGG
ncbi:MAG: hypothetical protein K9H16_07305 [Bacteroidales bacterium]|nr:hypothetical protein [Bacteroidales bacterium]